MNVAFAYSQIHFTAALGLHYGKLLAQSRHLHIICTNKVFSSSQELLQTTRYINFLKRNNIHITFELFSSPGTGAKIQEKLLAYFINSLAFRKIKCESVLIPNFANPYIHIRLRNISYHSLLYIDEGFAYASYTRFTCLNHSSRVFRILKYIFPLMSPISLPLSKAFSGFTFFSSKLSEVLADTPFADKLFPLELHMRLLLDDIYMDIQEEPITANSYVLVTSPMTENGYTTSYGEEIAIYKSFVQQMSAQNPSTCFYIKQHYREKSSKYEPLLAQSNVHLIESNLPFQDLYYYYKNATVVGFHSSAIFSLKLMGLDVNIISLLPSIKSQSSLALLASMSHFRDDPRVKFLEISP